MKSRTVTVTALLITFAIGANSLGSTLQSLDADGRHLLRFWAVDYRVEVWLNGTRVGEHQGGEAPFVLDVTDAIRTGPKQNLLATTRGPASRLRATTQGAGVLKTATAANRRRKTS